MHGCTDAGISVVSLLSPIPLWLAISLQPVPFLRTCFDILHGWLDLDHVSSEGIGDAGTHARFGRRLTLATELLSSLCCVLLDCSILV